MKSNANSNCKTERLPAFVRHALLFSAGLFLVLSLSGTKACQEDYEFGVRSQIAASATPTEDGDLITETPTGTGTPGGTTTPTPEPGVTGTVTATATGAETAVVSQANNAGTDLLQLLGRLSESPTPEAKPLPKPIPDGSGGISRRVENWLGNLYADQKDGSAPGAGEAALDDVDSDSDGYTDLAETKLASDPRDPEDAPRINITTSLDKRMAAADEDEDGLEDDEEDQYGTFSDISDSDGDAATDGAEILSGSDPMDARSKPAPDTDHDGLSDTFEQNSNLNALSADSDRDGVRDDLEMALGTNPFHIDTDKDGLIDGMELKLGSDPLKPEAATTVK